MNSFALRESLLPEFCCWFQNILETRGTQRNYDFRLAVSKIKSGRSSPKKWICYEAPKVSIVWKDLIVAPQSWNGSLVLQPEESKVESGDFDQSSIGREAKSDCSIGRNYWAIDSISLLNTCKAWTTRFKLKDAAITKKSVARLRQLSLTKATQ